MFPLKERKLIRGFRAHIDAGLEGAADYIAEYENLYAPFSGFVVAYDGVQGGRWLRLTRNNGDQIEFAHLDKRFADRADVKAGELIAITGNSGQVTTGFHLHIQIIRDGQRLDPETYPWEMFKMKYTCFNADPAIMEQARQIIVRTSGGLLDCEFIYQTIPVSRSADLITFDDINEFLDANPTDTPFVFINYQANTPNYDYASTQSIKNKYVTVAEFGVPAFAIAYEMTHAIQIYYNNHRGSNSAVSIEDINTPDENFLIKKLQTVIPFLSELNNKTQDMKIEKLVRAGKDVFVIKNGEKNLFLNKESFEILDGRWDKIETITQTELDAIPDGYVLIAVKQE